MNKKTSLARDFTIFSAVILLAVVFMCVLVGLHVHQNYYENQKDKIAHKAKILDDTLEDSLSFVNHYINFIGEKISKAKVLSPEYLTDLFTVGSYKGHAGIPEWTIFSWINPDNKIIISSVEGEIHSDLALNSREYLKITPHKPWHLFFSSPSVGAVSNQPILPAGLGVTNNKKFLGTIGVGLGIIKLTNELQRSLASNALVFILLDSNFNYILSSKDVSHSGVKSLINQKSIDKLKENITPGNLSGPLKDVIENELFSFNYYKHSSKYPFYFLIGENKRIANNEYWKIAFPRVAELCIMGLCFVIILYYLRRRIVSPILSLVETATKIAHGDHNVRINFGRYSEVNLLATQLKDIQSAKTILSTAKKDADILNLELEEKIQERTADLEKALAIRTEFLNSISHEVRTPVQGITTISRGLVEFWNEHTEEKKLALASAVASNSQRLFSLVSNVLDLSAFNAGALHFNMQKLNLVDLVNDIIVECQILYLSNKSITILFNHDNKEEYLEGDYEKISQVLRNLLTNSIKFMSDGVIEVEILQSLGFDQEHLLYTIVVKDQGINIPEEDLKKIFLPFIQSGATKGKVSGAGLGLSICNKIIKGHSGKIWATNNEENGVNISFTLPANQSNEKK